MKIINAILNHLGKRNYSKLNKRIDELEHKLYRRVNSSNQTLQEKLIEDVTRRTTSLASVDFNKILLQEGRISMLEGQLQGVINTLTKKKVKKSKKE